MHLKLINDGVSVAKKESFNSSWVRRFLFSSQTIVFRYLKRKKIPFILIFSVLWKFSFLCSGGVIWILRWCMCKVEVSHQMWLHFLSRACIKSLEGSDFRFRESMSLLHHFNLFCFILVCSKEIAHFCYGLNLQFLWVLSKTLIMDCVVFYHAVMAHYV